jgi:hypothetical protein
MASGVLEESIKAGCRVVVGGIDLKRRSAGRGVTTSAVAGERALIPVAVLLEPELLKSACAPVAVLPVPALK